MDFARPAGGVGVYRRLRELALDRGFAGQYPAAMHDIKLIRENPEAFAKAQRRRGPFSVDPVIDLDARVRGSLVEIEDLKAQANTLSREFGEFKRRNEGAPAKLVEDIAWHKERLATIAGNPNQNPDELKRQLDLILESLPNLPADDVPEGGGEDENVEVARWGAPRDAEGCRDHVDLGAALGLDFESAQKVSGARFAYLRGPMARLNRALGAFMLDTHTTKFGYQEVAPPVLVRDEALYGTAQLPKFEEDLFWTTRRFNRDEFEREYVGRYLAGYRRAMGEGWNEDVVCEEAAKEANQLFAQVPNPIERLWLIPTAEVSLTNLVREAILSEAELPLRFTALTPCFRSEAGAAGKDTRGLVRQHQFDKVEMVSITTPEAAEAEHERMTAAAEYVLETLGLPYRRMLLCAGDMGFSARKTFDLEVWLPGQGRYREISSCSNCGDFQARRMQARFRPEGEKKGTRFVHTLNGSGLAVGRTLVAVLENWQNGDGSVRVPPALVPWMGGVELLEPAR